DRVRGLSDVPAQRARHRLGGRLQAAPGDVEQPAMEGAAQAPGFAPTEGKVGAAGRAMTGGHAKTAPVVLGRNENLAQQTPGFDRTRTVELIDERGRLPVAAHESAAGRARTYAGDEIVVLGAHHGASLQSPVSRAS